MVKKKSVSSSIMFYMGYLNNRKSAHEIFYASLKAVDPYKSVKLHSERIRSLYQNGDFNRLMVIGFGKASYPMAKAMEDYMLDLIDAGILITKYGHSGKDKLKKMDIYEAGHPVPDENGLKGTEEILKLLKDTGENTLTVCLISGGGSSLLVAPYRGISIDEKQSITRLLLNAGADIYEINTVRKHISRVKGGRLAETIYPAKIISLILSDVIGDRLDVIASGPTSPDTTTYQDAVKVLRKYNVLNKTPHPIIDVLNKGVNALLPETPKADNPVFEKVENIILCSNRKAIEAAKSKAEEIGFSAEIISVQITGEAREVGKWLAEKVKKLKKKNNFKGPLCLVSGGETTVTVQGNGLGGRNMELSLSFAIEIEGIEGISFLSAGTDGTDGPTDAAGAFSDGLTASKAKASGLDPEEYLRNNDSYNFFKKIDSLFITGATGTNVMDLHIVIIE